MRTEIVAAPATAHRNTVRANALGSTVRISSPMTFLLIGVNVATYFLLPMAFPGRYPYRLEGLGSAWGPLVFSGEWWRLLTCSFVHFQLFHLLPNMVGLWILGTRTEHELGKKTFLFFYLACGIVVALVVLALNPFTAFIGASGAVAALAGAIITIYAPRFMLLSWRAKTKFGILILLMAALVAREFARGGLYLAHTSGLLTGAILCLFLVYVAKTRRARAWTFIGLVPLLMGAAIFVQRYHR